MSIPNEKINVDLLRAKKLSPWSPPLTFLKGLYDKIFIGFGESQAKTQLGVIRL